MVAAKDELSTRKRHRQRASNVSSRVPPNLETLSSKEEMKNAGGDRPHPYQLGYFFLGRPCPACSAIDDEQR
jgi:hypothetical protein